MFVYRLSALLPLLVFSSGLLFAQKDEETVDWMSDYDEAVREAKKTGKPIFLEYRCEP